MPQLLTMQDLAKIVGCCPRTIQRMRFAGALPKPAKIGKRLVRWPAAVIERWLKAGCPATSRRR